MYQLFLDDERLPPGDGWIVVRSVEAAIACVEANGFPAFISFDNDLGQDASGANRPEGWRFAQWLVERDLGVGGMPDGFAFCVHSQNPVRRDDIVARLRHYLDWRVAACGRAVP